MSEIPEDVRRAAAQIWDANSGALISGMRGERVVELAILSERKRCAAVARHLNGWGPVGGNIVAEHIAEVIELGAGWGVEK